MKTNKIDKPKVASIIAAQPTNAKPIPVSTAIRKRRFDETSIEEYATLAALRFTDEEICSKMNWPFSTFRRWKTRTQNSEKLSHLMKRARMAKLQSHIENIEDASQGKGPHARADWRASAHIAAIISPERYGKHETSTNATTNQTAIVLACGGDDGLRKIIHAAMQSASVPTPSPQPRIECPANGQNDKAIET